ncbi:c-type cytochrome [Runella zeae]|uniref:c-type cytochrome n=1 Tax=Runella zeae TaxID=94255 RepID=UPI0003F8FEF9|nr:cytochrome c [Runella zeae]
MPHKIIYFSKYTGLMALVVWISITSCQDQERVKRDQYLAEGFALFDTHCANCHQRDGKGLENLYPAISLEHLKNKEQVICWIKYGIHQPMTVNGKNFDRPMPANPALKELEIAEITTYLYNTWGKETSITTIDTVEKALEKCTLSL